MLQTNLFANKPSLKEVCICCYVWNEYNSSFEMHHNNIWQEMEMYKYAWLFGNKTISALIDYLFLRVKNACFDSDCLPFSTIDHDILG